VLQIWLKDATTTLVDLWPAPPRAPRFAGSWSHWDAIRAAWDVQSPTILAGIRVSPYFYHWSMAPIEAAAWQELREHGLPLYPQCPVGDLFIDFGDPVLRIELELDGKDFHDYERDKARDFALWRDHGWRIIRIGAGLVMKNFAVQQTQTSPTALRETQRNTSTI
jgi:very-short-patch-repair endonuclease